MMLLEVRSLAKGFDVNNGRLEVLKDVNLKVKKGESVAVVGRSGSGKSTLLGLLCGLDRADRGELSFDGQKFSSLSERELTALRATKIGMVFQQFHLLPHLKAWENVALPLELAGDEKSQEKAYQLLNDVGLGERLEHFPAQLSGGEQQRVAIARAMAIGPQMILADEPSGSLDESTGEGVMDLLFQLVKDHQTALLIVTHSSSLAAKCDRVLTMEAGVLKDGSDS
jgi:putative ABC transport system ATP-binding protein